MIELLVAWCLIGALTWIAVLVTDKLDGVDYIPGEVFLVIPCAVLGVLVLVIILVVHKHPTFLQKLIRKHLRRKYPHD